MKPILRFLAVVSLAAACARPDPAPAPDPARAPRPPLAPQLITHATADHTCVLDGLGAVACWGRNDHGQLGEPGAVTARARVVLPERVVMIAVGTRHTCALDEAQGAWCWGANDRAQLGTEDSSAPSPLPVRVGTERRFARITAGAAHTCALDADGDAFCWGDNRWGQLGNGTRASSARPVPVATDAAFLRLAAGSRHTCGVTTEGRALCWGDNFLGQLGVRGTQGELAPVAVPDVDIVVALTAGHGHTCALGTDGAAWCWGQNGIGQLGTGQPPGAGTPARVANTPPLAEIRAGYHHTCAVDVEGGGWCWGANTTSEPGAAAVTGQLGSEVSWTNLPARIELEHPLASIAPGDGHTCALTRAGVIYCFGSNRYGQIGQPEPARAVDPVRVMRAEPDPETMLP